MHISVITHLSAKSYRLKTLKLLLKSLLLQTNQNFELIIVVHDKEDKTSVVQNAINEVAPLLQTSVCYLPLVNGYQSNAARNLGHSLANYPFHLAIDVDIVLPQNFFEVIQKKANDKTHDCMFDIYTFLHCGTRGWSNAKLGNKIGGEIGDYVTEQQLEEMNLEEKLRKGMDFIEQLNKRAGVVCRSYESIDIYALARECTKDEITMYWSHPLAAISDNYRAKEFYFLCHKEFLQAIDGWPKADKIKNRSCGKAIMADILYYLHDKKMITLHTITDIFLMHIEHPRPYNMVNDSLTRKIRTEVQQPEFMKLIMNKVNKLWLLKQKEVL